LVNKEKIMGQLKKRTIIKCKIEHIKKRLKNNKIPSITAKSAIKIKIIINIT
jgi:hypothetical protein